MDSPQGNVLTQHGMYYSGGLHESVVGVIHSLKFPTWTTKGNKIMVFMAIIMVLGPLFYILLGFRPVSVSPKPHKSKICGDFCFSLSPICPNSA